MNILGSFLWGQVLLQRPLALTSGTIQLDMVAHPSGVYNCQLLDSNGAVIAAANILVSK